MIYKKNINKLLKFMNFIDQEIIQEVKHFQKNDSDNEENYPDVYKNCDNIDSVSDYDTDTDDETTKKLRKKLVVKTSAVKKKYESIKVTLPVKFKKIHN